jgi:hypothetical protein
MGGNPPQEIWRGPFVPSSAEIRLLKIVGRLSGPEESRPAKVSRSEKAFESAVRGPFFVSRTSRETDSESIRLGPGGREEASEIRPSSAREPEDETRFRRVWSPPS